MKVQTIDIYGFPKRPLFSRKNSDFFDKSNEAIYKITDLFAGISILYFPLLSDVKHFD